MKLSTFGKNYLFIAKSVLYLVGTVYLTMQLSIVFVSMILISFFYSFSMYSRKSFGRFIEAEKVTVDSVQPSLSDFERYQQQFAHLTSLNSVKPDAPQKIYRLAWLQTVIENLFVCSILVTLLQLIEEPSFLYIILFFFYFVFTFGLSLFRFKKKYKLMSAYKLERQLNQLEQSGPLFFCPTHRVRCKKRYTVWPYQVLVSRIDPNYETTSNLQLARQIVGVMGYSADMPQKADHFYFDVWDEEQKRIRNGDLDALLIRKTDGIKDYDRMLQQLFVALQSDLNRPRPIHEIEVVLINDPPLSANSLTLLEQNFGKVRTVNSE